MFLSGTRILYVGSLVATKRHAHHAAQIVVAPEGLTIEDGAGGRTRVRAAVIPPRMPHEHGPCAHAAFIYLSAGVDNEVFIENLAMAAESGTDYSGVLCGRATWKNGIPIYGKQGVKALEDWLSDEGVKNINKVNEAIKTAKPWYAKYGLTAAALA